MPHLKVQGSEVKIGGVTWSILRNPIPLELVSIYHHQPFSLYLWHGFCYESEELEGIRAKIANWYWLPTKYSLVVTMTNNMKHKNHSCCQLFLGWAEQVNETVWSQAVSQVCHQLNS